jgi:hypothetical protein
MRNSRIIYSVTIVIFLLFLIAPLLPASTNLVAANPTFVLYLPLIMKSVPTASLTPTPTVTPTPTSSTQLLVNGDFESGPDVGWVTEGGAFVVNDPSGARRGSWYALFGGSSSVVDAIRQQVAVPVNMPYLSYWDTALSYQVGCYYDTAYVYINSNFVQSIYDFCQSREHLVYKQHVIDLHSYVGQTVTLRFKMNTNAGYASYWSIDDVMFQSSP